jgi:hypothetical protein
METAVLEADWRQQACMDLVMDMLEGAVKESRQRMCKQIIVESVVCSSWQSLEVRRLVRETKEGGLDRMEQVESELRMEREERECVAALLEEERCIGNRLRKK